jgi:hypothetical protein
MELQAQQNQLARLTGGDLAERYRVPNVLDAAVCILMHYVETGERLFADTYTLCREQAEGWRVTIGGFWEKGLCISNDASRASFGTAALRIF